MSMLGGLDLENLGGGRRFLGRVSAARETERLLKPWACPSERNVQCERTVDRAADLAHLHGALAGETGPWPGAEGVTTPETLRQKDRDGF
jgi:hypothetical protein